MLRAWLLHDDFGLQTSDSVASVSRPFIYPTGSYNSASRAVLLALSNSKRTTIYWVVVDKAPHKLSQLVRTGMELGESKQIRYHGAYNGYVYKIL